MATSTLGYIYIKLEIAVFLYVLLIREIEANLHSSTTYMWQHGYMYEIRSEKVRVRKLVNLQRRRERRWLRGKGG